MFTYTMFKNTKCAPLCDKNVIKGGKIAKQKQCTKSKVSESLKKIVHPLLLCNPDKEPYAFSSDIQTRFEYSDEEWEYVQCFL
jgi:hypothetical protein